MDTRQLAKFLAEIDQWSVKPQVHYASISKKDYSSTCAAMAYSLYSQWVRGQEPFMPDEKRLNVKLDSEKHELFRRACMRNESTMTEQILAFIDRYIADNTVSKKPE